MERYDVLVIGGGQAGLGVSYLLRQQGIGHLVLERDRIGQSWRSQRWASFRLNTPNRYNTLPGATPGAHDADGFMSHHELLQMLEGYARGHALPVREHAEVTSVEQDSSGFVARVHGEPLFAHNVIVCTGTQTARLPSFARHVAPEIAQVHTADYRTPEALPDGGVLVVGGGQSGVQIAEDLVEAGRKTWLCTSRVGRMVRRYRGKDILEWLYLTGVMAQTPAALEDPAEQHLPLPQISGARGGHTVSLQRLARQGVQLLGRLEGIEGSRARVASDLRSNVEYADAFSAQIRARIDFYIRLRRLEAPAAELDEAELPFEDTERMAGVRVLDLRSNGIRSIIWCTGFAATFDWLKLPVMDDRGWPRHDNGKSSVPGLYFLGFPWLRTRDSGTIHSIEDDAMATVQHLVGRRLRNETDEKRPEEATNYARAEPDSRGEKQRSRGRT